MLYIELIRLWNEAVQAIDSRDWQEALSKLNQITDHSCRTMFVVASTHIALGQVDLAIKALDQVIAKDSCLAVGFFQRSAVHLMANRLEEALTDCIWAQKYMRENPVFYNAAAVHSRLQQWDKARDILLSASEERGAARGNLIDTAIETVSRREVLEPLLVPEGEVFRPRKQEVDQLKPRDFLGEAKVITSLIPNDDFRGFDPLRPQKPGYYEPDVEDGQDSRYMITKSLHVAKGAGELTVPAGAEVFVYSEDSKDGLAVVIYDGKRGLVPQSLLEHIVKKTKGKTRRLELANGIPHPPTLNPPNRPQGPPQRQPQAEHPSSAGTSHTTYPSGSSTRLPTERDQASPQESGSVVVKVHYSYNLALRVPLKTSFRDLQGIIAQKVGQSSRNLRLRHRRHGCKVLTPLNADDILNSLEEISESGRAQIWCQKEDPLTNRTILYQMVALYDYKAEGPEDLEFREGDTIDILGEVNKEWLEGHVAGFIGIFPRSFAHRETEVICEASTE
ncbi:hypothetical protein DNTS_011950 [Danionella cerebrum]|uniref:SH3 domain-containing protein n=1 Tax=Danionella cerebrum TaxID=2873325 RepID=A0A553QW63_9TELE|nr:hypothetical protein DNTS_011950 [Danionella translucida]